ncbi:actinorhodin polyketide putative beta-ketoacyl synthase 2 [Streptomyces humidus]|uniref:Actinorhodin polyketide putative beta-ketoacyl synthase 2 n=1 Tax=Streptomyces humidus TaxID=52259 RepID=A0A918L584_9ACTN|nr:ketosynthase chain-length factor [Streptomyces humidus]GGS05534.1 actinorhodin polyketide putative beta-ketoacyl synthase 2 [Streptomyces humidus]
MTARTVAGAGTGRPGPPSPYARPPVVTGIGVLAANGSSTEEYWAAVLRGDSGIARITLFDPDDYPARLAGEVKGFDARKSLPGRLLPQTDRMTRLALVAADAAIADSAVDVPGLGRYACGVVTAASGGGFEFGQRELEALWSRGGGHVSAYQSFAWFYPVNTGQISIRHDMRGAGAALVAEQAGGLDAVAKACRHVRDGTPFMVTGGVDSAMCPWGWLCMTRSGRLTTVRDPRRAYVPFDHDASGLVPGEGGALLTLEDPDLARTRGAVPYGAIVGYAATFDPRPGSGRPPGLRRAVELALDEAGLTAADIDVVFADAAGLPEPDRIEADTLAAVFGPRAVPVTAPKTMTGRLLAGGGALDVATALLSLRDGVIPPTVHIDRPAHADALDLVTGAPRETALRCALVLARGYGGHNSALVVRRAG